MRIAFKNIIVYTLLLMFFSCTVQIKLSTEKEGGQTENSVEILVENTRSKTYKGWWVYGEGQYIFKDEQTLEEYDLEFPNENMEELRNLYLAVCEMEYFPMECAMTGYLKKNILEKQTTLVVVSFKILYIEGCGE
ncbi:MAG: hypothetical protein VYB55_03390 [Bacteroidota bacterium]|nr:hypothetical protein [Bacteroidota bacterium]